MNYSKQIHLMFCSVVAVAVVVSGCDSKDGGNVWAFGLPSSQVEAEVDSSGSDAIDTRVSPDAPAARSPYICDADGGRVKRPAPDREFEKPERPDPGRAPTAESIEAEFGSEIPAAGSILNAPKRLEPGNSRAEGLYAYADPPREESVVLHFASLHPKGAEVDGEQVSLTLLLNYRPVEATFTHYSDDRSEVLERVEGSSAQFPIDGPAEIFDLRVPSEEFRDGFIHDLALGYQWGGGEMHEITKFRRIRVYYGGYRRPAHDCLPLGNRQRRTDRDEALKSIGETAVIAPKDADAGEASRDSAIPARRGEEITVEYRLTTAVSGRYRPTAMIPLVDGKPLGGPRFVVALPNRPRTAFNITDQGSFTVEMPETSGEHVVQLGTWRDPYLQPDDEPGSPDGLESQRIKVRRDALFGSNVLRFDVE